jgi:hypothetical protein
MSPRSGADVTFDFDREPPRDAAARYRQVDPSCGVNVPIAV